MSRAEPLELLSEADERMHDLDDRRRAGAFVQATRGADDRPHLHLVDLGEDQADAAAAHAEHRVCLLEHANALAHVLVRRLLERRQELVQRGVEQADRHGEPDHRLEDPLEVRLLHREDAVERRAAAVDGVREDHLPHHGQPILGHEHVLGAAKADALRAELARLRGVLGRIGVRPDAQPPEPVRPAEDRLEVLVDLRRHERHLTEDHAAGTAVDRQHVFLPQLVAVEDGAPGGDVDREPLAACDTRLAHAARDDRRVRRHASVGCQHPLRLEQAVDVVGRRLPADEDDRVSRLPPLFSGASVEDHPPGRRAW